MVLPFSRFFYRFLGFAITFLPFSRFHFLGLLQVLKACFDDWGAYFGKFQRCFKAVSCLWVGCLSYGDQPMFLFENALSLAFQVT